MAVIQFVPATREAVYSRICFHGPGGAGKTFTSLAAMHTLCNGSKFAVIDTERGRSKKYVGVNGWQFDILEPHSFAPDSLTEALGVAAGAGYPGIIIDSGSQYWNGVDGMQEQVDRRTAAAGRKDSYGSGWRDMAPIERRMWDAIMSYPGHVVMTLRVKSAYVVDEKERNGRVVSTPRKVGLKPVQRDGFEYEFDLVMECDQDNEFTVTKSDILIVPQGTSVARPGPEFFDTIKQFCAEGVETTSSTAYRSRALDPKATREALRELLDEVDRAGLKHAPVVDELDRPTVLGDLILSRGRALKAAEEAAQREASRQQASAQAAPKPESPAVRPQQTEDAKPKQAAAQANAAPAAKAGSSLATVGSAVQANRKGLITRDQYTQLGKLYTGKLRLPNPQTQLRLATRLLELPAPLTDPKQLTADQAVKLLKELENIAEAGEAADALIAEILQRTDEPVSA